MRDLVVLRVDIVREHRDDRAAVLRDEGLHLGIHLGPPCLIQFRPRLKQQFVEALVVPVALVPLDPFGIDEAEHVVLGRAAVPVAHAEGLFQPDIGPVAVLGLALDVDLDARSLGRLLEQQGCVHSASEGGFGGGQIHLQPVHARLLEIVPGLVRVVGVLRNIGRVVTVRGRDRAVICHLPIAAQHLVDDLLPVDGVLEREAHIHIAERRHVAEHRHGVMRGSHGLDDANAGTALQQVDRGQVGAVDDIHLACHQRVLARRRVVDGLDLHVVEPGPVRLPVIVPPLERDAHARLMVLQHIAAGAEAGFPVQRAVLLCGHDDEVVVRGHVGEVGIARGQFEHDRVLAIRTDVRHLRQRGLGGGFGILAPVMIERRDHIGGRQLAPV